jgi:hypothetical protein
MPTNPYFDFYKNRPEQNLVEDLIHEAVKMFGFDCYYIPRNQSVVSDLLYGDDPLKKFDAAYPMEVYLTNSVDPGMNNDFFSKFGLEIKNTIRIQVPRRAFAKRVPQDTHTRPKEGDLVYIPFLSGTGELYEIKYTNDATDYFTLGRKQPYYWELELELFKYSHEDMNTGVEEIDVVEQVNSFAIDYILNTGTGNFKVNELAYQGSVGSPTSFATVQNWNAPTKTLKVTNMSGIFDSDLNVIGSESGANYSIQNFDELDNPQIRDGWDNKVIEDISDTVIDTSESNPFGIL